MKTTFKTRFWKAFAAILCISVALYALLAYSFWPAGTTVHPSMQRVYAANPWAIYLHVFVSLTTLLIAPFQLSERFRNASAQRHRMLGKVYLCCVLVGGLAAFRLAYLAYGGLVSQWGFGLLAAAWLYSGYQAYASARKLDFTAHQRWVWINVALSFAAVTLRIYLGVFSALGMPFDAFYPLVSWLCWVPNVLFIEWYLLKRLQLRS